MQLQVDSMLGKYPLLVQEFTVVFSQYYNIQYIVLWVRNTNINTDINIYTSNYNN